MANGKTIQIAQISAIIFMAIALMTIAYGAGKFSNQIEMNKDANAATVELIGKTTGLIGGNTERIITENQKIWNEIMTIKERLAALEALQERNQ